MKICAILLLLSATSICFRVPNSPYPFSTYPASTIQIIESSSYSNDELLCIQSLQGSIAQNQPIIYNVNNSGMKLWLEDIALTTSVTLDYTLLLTSLTNILSIYKNETSQGYILCNSNSASTNVALSLCGINPGTIVATPSIQSDLESIGIAMFMDVRGKTTDWLWNNYQDSFSSSIIVYQEPDKSMVALADYGVFTRSVMLNDSTSSSIAENVISSLSNNSALLGWGESEQGLVSWASQNSVMVNAADWAVDLSVLSNLPLSNNYFPIQQQDLIETNLSNCSRHTVCFVMSDGDNIQWILNSLAVDTNWWASNQRGEVPITWTISPALIDLAPSVLKYFYTTASNNHQTNGSDYFIGAPSGTGYNYPDLYNDLNGFTNLTNSFMEYADLSILNIIADSNPELSDTSPYTEQKQIQALFWYLYSNYAGLEGQITWNNNKPIIGARYMLWDGYETPTSLAEKLNNASTNCTSEDGYSLIVVHVWDQTVDSVVDTVALLNNNVKVVQANEFVDSIKTNLKH